MTLDPATLLEQLVEHLAHSTSPDRGQILRRSGNTGEEILLELMLDAESVSA